MFSTIHSSVMSLMSASATYFPSRKIVTWSPISIISSSLCEIYTIEIPCSSNSRMILNNTLTSAADNELVGSSIIKTRKSLSTKFRAISTICCCPTRKSPTIVSGGISCSRRLRIFIAPSTCCLSSRKPMLVFSWFMKIFW